MPIMMSIRTIHCDNILDGYKNIEFRKFFDVNYKGTIIVYECGEGSIHKVRFKFHTKNIVKYDPVVGVNEQVLRCFATAKYTTFDVDCLKQLKQPMFCIPIVNPTPIKIMPLDEFSALYDTTPKFSRPPQSWQRFTCAAKRK